MSRKNIGCLNFNVMRCDNCGCDLERCSGLLKAKAVQFFSCVLFFFLKESSLSADVGLSTAFLPVVLIYIIRSPFRQLGLRARSCGDCLFLQSWIIWKEKNSGCFEGLASSDNCLVEKAKLIVALWVLSSPF